MTEPAPLPRGPVSCACGSVTLGACYLAVHDEETGVSHSDVVCLPMGLGADGLPTGLPPQAEDPPW